MAVRIIHRKDGMYDVYDRESGKWLFSRNSADNLLGCLSEQKLILVDFIDEAIQKEGADNG